MHDLFVLPLSNTYSAPQYLKSFLESHPTYTDPIFEHSWIKSATIWGWGELVVTLDIFRRACLWAPYRQQVTLQEAGCCRRRWSSGLNQAGFLIGFLASSCDLPDTHISVVVFKHKAGLTQAILMPEVDKADGGPSCFMYKTPNTDKHYSPILLMTKLSCCLHHTQRKLRSSWFPFRTIGKWLYFKPILGKPEAW